MKKFLRRCSVGRFLPLVLGGGLAGYMTALLGSWCQPAVYRGVRVVSGREQAGREVPLAPVHAALIRRDHMLDYHREVRVPGDDLCAAITFRGVAGGVEVSALSHDSKEARMLAGKAAEFFRGMDREVELAGRGTVEIPPGERRWEAVSLRRLLDEQAKAAGFTSGFELVDRAAAGDPAAVALRDSEDFSRRWDMFTGMAMAIGVDGVPGEMPTAARAMLRSPFQEDGSMMDIRSSGWLETGTWSGLGLGLMVGLLGARRPDGRGTGEERSPAVPAAEW